MKVLKQGGKPQPVEWLLVGQCPLCDCIFVLEDEDKKNMTTRGFLFKKYFFNCPMKFCGTETMLKAIPGTIETIQVEES